MSSRNILRAFTRKFSAPAGTKGPRDPVEFFRHGTVEDADATIRLWKKVLYFVCIPSLGLVAYNTFTEPEPERPEFIPYEHLRIRTKRFPWGDGNHSLFHNPRVNALPNGYEMPQHDH